MSEAIDKLRAALALLLPVYDHAVVLAVDGAPVVNVGHLRQVLESHDRRETLLRAALAVARNVQKVVESEEVLHVAMCLETALLAELEPQGGGGKAP